MASCNVCGKAVSFGNKISHSHRRSNRTWKPNIRKIRTTNEHGTPMRIGICTRCLRSGKSRRSA